MFKKIRLFHQIRKFYKAFFSEDEAFIHKLSDMTTNNVYDVIFDINEVLDANSYGFYEEGNEVDDWLTELREKIYNFCEPKTKHPIAITVTVAVAIILTLLGGYTIGRCHTIRQAELLESTESEYYIGYGDEVHVYTFED